MMRPALRRGQIKMIHYPALLAAGLVVCIGALGLAARAGDPDSLELYGVDDSPPGRDR